MRFHQSPPPSPSSSPSNKNTNTNNNREEQQFHTILIDDDSIITTAMPISNTNQPKKKKRCCVLSTSRIIGCILFVSLLYHWQSYMYDEDHDASHSTSSTLQSQTASFTNAVISESTAATTSTSFWSSSLSSAAELLQCQDSVLNFVINATDKKDECDGLRKAFDITCSQNHDMESTTTAAAAAAGSGQRRRLLSSTITASTLVTTLHQKWKQYWRSVSSLTMHSSRNRKLETTTLTAAATAKNATTVIHKPLSPSLPTSNEHIGNQMANDAISINDGKAEEIAAIIQEIQNHTNSTIESVTASTTSTTTAAAGSSTQTTTSNTVVNEVEVAKEEAHVSVEAITTATAVVDAVLNSPESRGARKCCASIINVFHEECDSPVDADYDDSKLIFVVLVIAVCGVVKSLIRHYQIKWLPEAGGCILVGVFSGFFITIFVPHLDFGFQHDMFLRIMVPPIVFEAALNIDKRSFQKMSVPIAIYAIFGTLLSTLLTASIIYYGTHSLGSWCTTIPFIESLVFGALISSIDPIAVLSVLSNLGMSDKDGIYILIFGESLLNDGIAIVLFQTLVGFMDENLVIDGAAIQTATQHFMVIAFGSLFVGIASGACATVYFYIMKGIQTPLVEVVMFLCWAFIPYYICDGAEWSGIVAIVAAGFFMDVYIVGNRNAIATTIDGNSSIDTASLNNSDSITSTTPTCTMEDVNLLKTIFKKEGFLSNIAKNHIGFVTEINSTLMETAIFSYLGIFLFNKRYHWNFWIPTMAILSCVVSRTIMIFLLSIVSNGLSKINWLRCCPTSSTATTSRSSQQQQDTGTTLIDIRMQIVLIFAGLRGAMSFALVETIPMFDANTQRGSRLKPELKQMTSAAILFTVFILGGCTYYLLERLGMSVGVGKDTTATSIELASLLEHDNGITTTSTTRRNNFPSGISKENTVSKHTSSSGDCLTHRQSRIYP